MHDARALVRMERCPARKGGLRGGNGQIDIFSGSNRAGADQLARCGVADFGSLAPGCVLPAAADVKLAVHLDHRAFSRAQSAS